MSSKVTHAATFWGQPTLRDRTFCGLKVRQFDILTTRVKGEVTCKRCLDMFA